MTIPEQESRLKTHNSKLTTQSSQLPMLGVNLPWVRYGEFGANAWQPAGGLSRRDDLDALATMLGEFRALGVQALRWFVLCDGRAGIRFGRDGEPMGPDDSLYRDFDAALALIRRAGLQLVPVLFDFTWCAPQKVVNGVQTGGRRQLLARAADRAALIEAVVDPLLARYSGEPSIIAWDVMNEPEWATRRVGTYVPWHGLSISTMREWLGALVRTVHSRTRHWATIGSASAHWLWLVQGLGLDVYQTHWYDHLERRAPLATALASTTLDAPAWLGECPTRGSRRTLDDIIATAAASGYTAVFVWSALAHDASTDATAARDALTRWRRAEGTESEGPPMVGASTSTTTTPQTGA
jgi:hypothetical protein